MPPVTLLEELIIEQAIRRAKQSGWCVVPANCYVVGVGTDEALRTGHVQAWTVYLSVHPFDNPSVQQPFRLTCRVEMLGDCLCVVDVQKPAERTRRVI